MYVHIQMLCTSRNLGRGDKVGTWKSYWTGLIALEELFYKFEGKSHGTKQQRDAVWEKIWRVGLYCRDEISFREFGFC